MKSHQPLRCEWRSKGDERRHSNTTYKINWAAMPRSDKHTYTDTLKTALMRNVTCICNWCVGGTVCHHQGKYLQVAHHHYGHRRSSTCSLTLLYMFKSGTVHIVIVGTAENMCCSWLTYPTKPDAELCLWEHGEVKPLRAWLDVEGLLFTPQRTKQPPGPAGEKIHDGQLAPSRHSRDSVAMPDRLCPLFPFKVLSSILVAHGRLFPWK